MTTTQGSKVHHTHPSPAAAVFEEVEEAAGRNKALWIGLGVGALALVGLVALTRSSRRARRRKAFWQTASLLLGQGRAEPPPPQQDGFVKHALKQAGMSLIAMGSQELGRRALRDWAPAEQDPAPERSTGRATQH